ncbi:MAG: hypothetical protein NT062_00300 [Proteobacteria bacterium]|nr:hypothetical protein [Pseudomonadota bacterium]
MAELSGGEPRLGEVLRALRRGRDLGPLVTALPAADLPELFGHLSVEKSPHRAAMCEANRQLLARVDEYPALLAPVAVSVVLGDHLATRTLLAAVRDRAAVVGESVHDTAFLLWRPKTHEPVLVLCETVVSARGLPARVYADTLGLVLGPRNSLRRSARQTRELLDLCLPYADADPTILHTAAAIELALDAPDAALGYVERAIAAGYDGDRLRKDVALRSLRKEHRWAVVLG